METVQHPGSVGAVEAENPPAALPIQPRFYGFWATLVLVAVAVVAAQLVAYISLAGWRLAQPGAVVSDKAAFLLLQVLLSSVIQVVILALLVPTPGPARRDYLGLVFPGVRDALIAVAAMIGLIVVVHGWMILLKGSISSYVIEMYRSAQGTGTLPLLLATIVVVGPAAEEITFRGFMFAGWSHTRIGVTGTIVGTSFLWTLTHGFVGWTFLTMLLGLGLIFGWVRWRTGSAILTFALHAIVNSVVMLDVWRIVGGMT